jgi:hypothetical protein
MLTLLAARASFNGEKKGRPKAAKVDSRFCNRSANGVGSARFRAAVTPAVVTEHPYGWSPLNFTGGRLPQPQRWQ